MRRIVLLGSACLSLAASICAADLSQFKTADELWEHIQQLEKQPLPSERAQYIGQMDELRSAFLEFETRFTSDPRRWDAKLTRARVESARARANDQAPDDGAFVAAMKEIVAAADASPAVKFDARFLIARLHLDALSSSGMSTNRAARTAVETDIAELRKNYPDDTRTAVMQFEFVQYLKLRDPAAAEPILRELEGSQNLQVAAMAQQQLLTLQSTVKLTKAPLDLKFQAVDGTQVDLAKLRGKVVMVDFWATWCGPCRMELPNVLAAYSRFHSNGFEIVGISLDQSKQRLLDYTKQAGMTWPEYFDGKSWGNDISSRYGINSIPTSWLVDKKGFVRSIEARGPDLAEQVKALLAE
jgi:thiol-disulfide isomerase/thioredoxin